MTGRTPPATWIVRSSAADWITASATLTVVRPCCSVTMSASLPSTASRNASCSVRSGSGLLIAYRIMSPSLTPRKCATSSQAVATVPLAWKDRSAVSVSAMNAPFSPVTTVSRSFIGDSQLTRWLVTVPSASLPVTAIRSSYCRPDLCALCADTVTNGDWVTQAVRSMSWVARSSTTPTSAIRDGNGPWRRVVIW